MRPPASGTEARWRVRTWLEQHAAASEGLAPLLSAICSDAVVLHLGDSIVTCARG